jgi:pantoate--beta-alanine ligase
VTAVLELRTASSVRDLVGGMRAVRETVAFVPTMGNLHDGHLSLMRLAAEQADKVVVSIFVNPTQFGPNEDFAAYPRTLDEDIARMTGIGVVAAVFVPDVAELYPFGADDPVRVTLPSLSRELCGAARPGHFDGVASVVCRLLNVVAPDVLVLGQKDYQQFVLLDRMVADLRMAVRVLCGKTIRDADGLALSSRNRYLTPQERASAPRLHATLQDVRQAVLRGESDYGRLQADAVAILRKAGFRPDYVALRRAKDLGQIAGGERPEELVALAAAWLGRARLIDNVRFSD